MGMFPLFIARRIYNRPADGAARQGATPPAIRIAVAAVAIGLAVMIVAVAVVVGFKREIEALVGRTAGHIHVEALADNSHYETTPLCVDDSLLDALKDRPGYREVSTYATKLCVLKTDSAFQAIGLTGEAPDRDWTFYTRHNESGTHPANPDEIYLPRPIASALKLQTGDEVKAYFVKREGAHDVTAWNAGGASVKVRTLRVSGIYATHFSEADSRQAVCLLPLLQDVSGWDDDMVSGVKIRLDDYARAQTEWESLTELLYGRSDRTGMPYRIRTTDTVYPQIFGWLSLLDTNVWVILILMGTVAAITMISGLLIIILERTATIGILKALGCPDGELRKIFLWVSGLLTLKGLVWGNVIGLGFCAVQYMWHPLTLDPENYYLEWVPVGLSLWHVVALNLGTAAVILLTMLIPSGIVSKISPSQAILSE